jgi:hypothetical protein
MVIIASTLQRYLFKTICCPLKAKNAIFVFYLHGNKRLFFDFQQHTGFVNKVNLFSAGLILSGLTTLTGRSRLPRIITF